MRRCKHGTNTDTRLLLSKRRICSITVPGMLYATIAGRMTFNTHKASCVKLASEHAGAEYQRRIGSEYTEIRAILCGTCRKKLRVNMLCLYGRSGRHYNFVELWQMREREFSGREDIPHNEKEGKRYPSQTSS